MKLSILADLHIGYSRFEEDAFVQAEHALVDAENKTDVILISGDIFDVKIPKLETIKHVIGIFSKIKKPIYLIHGNHERRSKDMTNPLELLSFLPNVHYLHGKTEVIEFEEEKISITGFGSVPEELAKDALKKVIGEIEINNSSFRILLMHQSLKELIYGEEEELSYDDLKDLPFDLIINGHIHKHYQEIGGKLLIPGSTVITQLKEDEQGERGYLIYDTKKKECKFTAIPSRLFFYNEMKFENASLHEIKKKIEDWIGEMRSKYRNPILKIKLSGTMKEGLRMNDISSTYSNNVYIQNNINVEVMSEKIKQMREQKEEKLSVRELAMRQLGEKLKGKITLFDPAELFEKLAESAEAGVEYINKKKH